MCQPSSTELYWALPAYERLYQAVLSSTKGQLCYTELYQAHRALLGSTKPYWALLKLTEALRSTKSHQALFRAPLGSTILLGSTDLCRALLGSTGLYRPLLGSTPTALPGFTGLYEALPGLLYHTKLY